MIERDRVPEGFGERGVGSKGIRARARPPKAPYRLLEGAQLYAQRDNGRRACHRGPASPSRETLGELAHGRRGRGSAFVRPRHHEDTAVFYGQFGGYHCHW
jgi:hypothetical protein